MSVILDPNFTSEDHRYSDHAGNVVPSVTDLIERYWPLDKRFLQGERGSRIHEVTAERDRGNLVNVPGDIEGYVRAWDAFKGDHVERFLLIEQPFIVPGLLYAGTLDRVYVRTGGGVTLLDIKTGKRDPWHELQQGAYTVAADRAGYSVDQIVTVQLRSNGKYQLVENDIDRATRAWICLIGWHNYRMEIGR